MLFNSKHEISFSLCHWTLTFAELIRSSVLGRVQDIRNKGGAVAEWSKALQLRGKINDKPKDPRFAPRPGQPLKKILGRSFKSNTKEDIANYDSKTFMVQTPVPTFRRSGCLTVATASPATRSSSRTSTGNTPAPTSAKVPTGPGSWPTTPSPLTCFVSPGYLN